MHSRKYVRKLFCVAVATSRMVGLQVKGDAYMLRFCSHFVYLFPPWQDNYSSVAYIDDFHINFPSTTNRKIY